MGFAKYLRDPGRIVRKLRWKRLHAGPRHDVTVDSWNGRLTFDSSDAFMGEPLVVDGAYDREVITHVTAWLERERGLSRNAEGVLVDIGANIGMITTTLLGRGWFHRSICFEPLPANLRLLRINMEQNALTSRVTALNVALSAAPGEFPMEITDGNMGDNRIRLPGTAGASPGAYGEERRKEVRVAVDTLDRALDDNGVRSSDVRVIWMDIQGHEAKCLQGASRTLDSGMPVVMELWPYGLARAGTTRTDFMQLITSRFARAHRVGDDGLTSMPIGDVERLFDQLTAPGAMCMLILS